jgi:hypothetical protein
MSRVVTVLRLEFSDTDIDDLRLDDVLHAVADECHRCGLNQPVLTRGIYLDEHGGGT